jgi:hypothetical protein
MLAPDDDPNEAYALIPAPPDGFWPSTWWTVTRYGNPVRHFSPAHRGNAERYCTDPAYRAELAATETPLHLRKKPAG